MKKPSYEELIQDPNMMTTIGTYLSEGIIDSRYLAGLQNHFIKEIRRVQKPHLPDKERPSFEFVFEAAIAILEHEMNAKDAMTYSANKLGKPKGYVDRMKHETIKLKSVVQAIENHPYKKVMSKHKHWQGDLYRSSDTPSKLINRLYKDVKKTKHDVMMAERVKVLEAKVREYELILNRLDSKSMDRAEKVEMTKNLKAQGHSINDLMTRFNVSKRTIHNWLKQ